MKQSVFFTLMSLLGSTHASQGECKEKSTTCQNRVEVLVSDLVYGLKDDTPSEVYEAFVTASSQCLNCVEKSDVKFLDAGDNSAMSYTQCRRAGCWCCTKSWCQNDDGSNYCPDQCLDRFTKCDNGRRLGGHDDDVNADVDDVGDAHNPYFVNYELDVCMDDMTPLDSSSPSYMDYNKMLTDMEGSLATCYEDKTEFLNTWAALCSGSGIDLSLMARNEGDTRTIMFGATGFDTENAVVTTYDSDESHRSTSHMIFYSALGFVTLSAFAVIGTAVVVKVLNKRREANAAQEAEWVSEMTNLETPNPVSA